MRRMLWLYLFVLVCFALPTPSFAQPQNNEVEALLNAMSLEHKVGQMFMVNLFGPVLTEAGRGILQTWQPGAVVILVSNAGNPAHITQLTNSYQQAITDVGGVPLFIATDQEGGLIARLQDGFTTWPVPMLLTATNDPDLSYLVGQGMGRELRAVGLNMNLAPVADLQTNLANPIIGRRSPGSDGQMVGQMVAGVVRGMEDAGVLAAVKHFPGHGDTSEDSHTTLPILPHGRDRLFDVELPPFISAIEAEVGSVMVAHIWFTAFDPDVPTPATLSYNIVTGLLREDIGYDGIIMTDAMDMDAIDTVYSPERASVLAIQAGIDLIIIGAHVGETIQARTMQAVVDAVRAGEIDEARIDASVRRILEAKQRYGVLDWSPLDVPTVAERMNLEAHAVLVQDVFEAGVSLAFDTHDVLPLTETDRVGIVFPGNRASIQRECGQYNDSIRWYAVSDWPTESEIATAVALAAQVDKLVVFTRDAYYNTAQQVMVNALPGEKTIVVAMISPHDWLRFPHVGAYMTTYSPLDPAIPAACGILFGVLPVRGILSVDLTN